MLSNRNQVYLAGRVKDVCQNLQGKRLEACIEVLDPATAVRNEFNLVAYGRAGEILADLDGATATIYGRVQKRRLEKGWETEIVVSGAREATEEDLKNPNQVNLEGTVVRQSVGITRSGKWIGRLVIRTRRSYDYNGKRAEELPVHHDVTVRAQELYKLDWLKEGDKAEVTGRLVIVEVLVGKRNKKGFAKFVEVVASMVIFPEFTLVEIEDGEEEKPRLKNVTAAKPEESYTQLF